MNRIDKILVAAGVLAGAPGDTSHQLERSIEAYSELAKANPF
jgi:hypothetical protein